MDLVVADGQRKIADFDPNQNLWEIIHSLFEDNPILNLAHDMELCVIYMRKEIAGEQLKRTNLKNLGLTRGKAALKLIVRSVDAVKEQASVVALNLNKPIETKKEEQKQEKSTVVQTTNKLDEPMQQTFDEKPLANPSEVLKSDTIQTFESLANGAKVNDNLTDDAKKTDALNEPQQSSSGIQPMEVESEESSDEGEEVLNYLGSDHSQVLFKMSDLPKISRIDYPDEFYHTTKDDLVKVLNDLRKQQVGDNEKILETKQMKEKKRREQMMRYKSTVVRICFPYDKLVFQAIFKPTHTIRQVMQVLSSYLSVQDFYLYTVPPKRNLNPESSLFESDLVPAALIHIGLESSNSGQSVIKEEFKSKLSSYKSAAKIAADARKDLIETAVIQSNNSVAAATGQPTHTRPQENSVDQREKKIPKWFKTNK